MRSKSDKSIVPKQFLFQLTLVNLIIIASFITLSSWAIYNTACMLADGMITVSVFNQKQFETTLFQYLMIFSISAVLIGSLIHFYLTKKLITPLRELIQSTKQMSEGNYPRPVQVNTKDEIGELSLHFNNLVNQLQRNEQYRRKLVSDLSHEFRTPLANLNGYLKALKSGVIEADEQLYQSLYEESKRLIQLVEQMEQLKEWDDASKKTLSDKESMDIQLAVEQCVRMFHWTLEKTGIKMNVQVESGYVNIHHGGISQVISNLIDNAVRYYDGEEGIIIKGEKLQSEYLLSVSGPSQPIPSSERERLFDRFYRLDDARSRELGGTGLGLAISKEIIEHHNGRIGIKPEGKVNTFWFALPLNSN